MYNTARQPAYPSQNTGHIILLLAQQQMLHNLHFQIHTGNQHLIELPERPVVMPLTLPRNPNINIVTLADKLKEVNYNTHYVGKWHLGRFQTRYWPTERGFDTFLGTYCISMIRKIYKRIRVLCVFGI